MAEPTTAVNCGVNVTAWTVLVVANRTSTFLLVEPYPEKTVAVSVPVEGIKDNVLLEERPVPVVVVAAPLNTGYIVEAVFVVATFTVVDVVAVPVTVPDKAPENVVAVIVLLDGLTLTVDTLDTAAPVILVVAGVNKIG